MAFTTAEELRIEGRIEGEIKGEKKAVLSTLKGRFGEVPQAISDTVNAYNDLTALRSLLAIVGSCKSLDDFKESLR